MSTGQVLWTLAAAGLVALGSPCSGAAQTDYYNTDAGRPALIEDVAVGFLPALPTPTVPRGASMAGMDHAEAEHGGRDHADEHHHPEADEEDMDPGAEAVMELLLRLLSDPAVQSRIHADPELHELWSAPEVQRLLEEMRQRSEGGSGPLTSCMTPTPAALAFTGAARRDTR